MDLLNLIEHAWVEYDNGFGNLNGEFLYGVKALCNVSLVKVVGRWE